MITVADVERYFAPAFTQVKENCERATRVLADVAEVRREEEAIYRQALDDFDWQFEFASGRQYTEGRDALVRLRAMQQGLDPTGTIWLAHPEAQKHGAPMPFIQKEAV